MAQYVNPQLIFPAMPVPTTQGSVDDMLSDPTFPKMTKFQVIYNEAWEEFNRIHDQYENPGLVNTGIPTAIMVTNDTAMSEPLVSDWAGPTNDIAPGNVGMFDHVALNNTGTLQSTPVTTNWVEEAAPANSFTAPEDAVLSAEMLTDPLSIDSSLPLEDVSASGTLAGRFLLPAGQTALSVLMAQPRARVRRSPPRPAGPRVHCTQCSDYPQGFRGRHELVRHQSAKHGNIIKRFEIIVDTGVTITAGGKGMTNPLEECRNCMGGKRYPSEQNAVAHLRQGHFAPGKRNGHRGKINLRDFPLEHMRPWIREIEVQVTPAPSAPPASSAPPPPPPAPALATGTQP